MDCKSCHKNSTVLPGYEFHLYKFSELASSSIQWVPGFKELANGQFKSIPFLAGFIQIKIEYSRTKQKW